MAKGDRNVDGEGREVREMRTAEQVLAIIHERGKRGLPLEDVYRQLYNPDLYLAAYGKIYRNAGAMTPGTTPETVDSMTQGKIGAIIGLLREEKYRWSPVRRVYIEKKNSTKKRPLGVPSWSDKLLQEAVRMILEAYYEPQFADRSHGFRPNRGCHTALREIYRTWRGTAWFIEGDIKGCFDNIDHAVLLSIIAEKVRDNRFLRLLDGLLKAGYLENWRYHETRSGTPQGGIVSPILTNIYLDRLDQYVAGTLIPQHTRGKSRKANPTYQTYHLKAWKLGKKGARREARNYEKIAQQLPSRDPNDPDYRRLRYIRYADDFLLGYTGTHEEAEAIKEKLREFLRDRMHLDLSEEKTLVTHARTEKARFLGYDVYTIHDDKAHTDGRRSINGVIGLGVPRDVIKEHCTRLMAHGKPIHRVELVNDDVFSIIRQYQAEYRGLVEYYRLAHNVRHLNTVKWVMEASLAKTLAHKLKTSVSQVYRRYHATATVEGKTYKVLQTTVVREGKRPLVATWGGIPLARKMAATLDDTIRPVWNARTEVVERLLADTCELCGSQDRVQVHHIRHLKDLRKHGKNPPGWVRTMAARQRKTLVVCHRCHTNIHAGRPTNVTGAA
jgi:group II intron reverse transcriptase/maturase